MMRNDTAEIIEGTKTCLGEDFTGAIFEGLGPDAINNFFTVQDSMAEKLLELAIEDEAELGHVIAMQLLKYLESCAKARNVKLDLAA